MQRSRPTQNKRARERARQEKQKEKFARRIQAKQRRETTPEVAPGEDPDIAGIVPGPQPSPWGFDDLEEPNADESESDSEEERDDS